MYHLTPIKMAIIKKFTVTHFGEYVQKRYSYTLLVRMQISTVTMENTWRFLKTLKIKLQYHLVAPLLSMCLEKTKTLFENIHASQCSLAKTWKPSRYPSTDNWIKKIREGGCVCLHTRTHPQWNVSHKGQNTAISSNMVGLSVKCLVMKKQLL